MDETERVLLDNAFDFSERVAREVMVPRNDLQCLFVKDSFAESVAVAMEAGYTRYPACHVDKDHPVGMIYLRDLCARGVVVESLHQIMRPIMVVPETVSVSLPLR